MTFASVLEMTIANGSSPISFVMILLGGIPVCREYVINKSTGQTSALSFITGFLLCSIWLVSGIFTENWYLVSINAIGLLLQASYILTFLHYATNKIVPFFQFLISFIPLAAVLIIYWALDEDAGIRETKASIIWVFCMIIFFGAPLSQMLEVLKTKSTETLPFVTILFSFITSFQFFIYGYLTDNLYFLQIPSVITIIFTGFLLTLFMIFPSDNAQKLKEYEKDMPELILDV